MVPLPRLNEEELGLIVSYSLEDGEEMSEAIIGAFLAAGVDVYEQSTQLADWINPAVLEGIQWSSDCPVYLCTEIWDKQVVITAEEVRIYNSQPFR